MTTLIRMAVFVIMLLAKIASHVALADSLMLPSNLQAQVRSINAMMVTIDVSRDGTAMVFSALGRNDQLDLYLMNLKTMSIHRLTDTPEMERWPSFSADGSSVVFTQSKDSFSPGGICIINLRDRAFHCVTNSPEYDDRNPSFSEDGKTIVFTRMTNSGLSNNLTAPAGPTQPAVYEVSLDGSHLRRLSPNGNYFSPMKALLGTFVVSSSTDAPGSPNDQTCVSAISNIPQEDLVMKRQFVLPGDCTEAKLASSDHAMFVLSQGFPNVSKWTVELRSLSRFGSLVQLFEYDGLVLGSAALTPRNALYFVAGTMNTFPTLFIKRTRELKPEIVAGQSLFTQPMSWKSHK